MLRRISAYSFLCFFPPVRTKNRSGRQKLLSRSNPVLTRVIVTHQCANWGTQERSCLCFKAHAFYLSCNVAKFRFTSAHLIYVLVLSLPADSLTQSSLSSVCFFVKEIKRNCLVILILLMFVDVASCLNTVNTFALKTNFINPYDNLLFRYSS